MRILIAEDDLSIADLVTGQLESAGFMVERRATGPEVWEEGEVGDYAAPLGRLMADHPAHAARRHGRRRRRSPPRLRRHDDHAETRRRSHRRGEARRVMSDDKIKGPTSYFPAIEKKYGRPSPNGRRWSGRALPQNIWSWWRC